MRNWNKLLALLLAMVMVFGLTATAFAADESDEKSETPSSASDIPETDEDKADAEDTTADTATPNDADDAAPADGDDATDDSAIPETETDAEVDYTDVADWAKEAVAFVVGEKKLVADRETGLEPVAAMTRAEMLAALYNLAEAPAVEGENEFTDVADTAFYKDAVVWGVANGITDGMGDGTFNPDGLLTRQHIAVFLYRYFNNVAKGNSSVDADSLASFPDADTVDSWGADGMKWAVANKLINGNGDLLDPNGPAQRQQVIVILYRYIQNVLPTVEAPADDAVQAPADDAEAPADDDADAENTPAESEED